MEVAINLENSQRRFIVVQYRMGRGEMVKKPLDWALSFRTIKPSGKVGVWL